MYDGTVKGEDKEGLEIAIQCIGESFGVDPSNQEQVKQLSIQPMTLQSIFDDHMKTHDKFATQASVSGDDTASSSRKVPTVEDKAKAEALKQEGNSLMTAKKFDSAIEAYTQAITLDATNPVYYSNRAAAYSSKSDHISAISDANKAIEVDPRYSKGYHRLGHALYSISDFKAAADAFERGLKVEPTNPGLKSSLASAKAKINAESEVSPRGTPAGVDDPSAGVGAGGGMGGLADMLKNIGGGGGGMPDLTSLMSNPAIKSMAQQMAQNGGLSRLMQDPAVADMMNRVQSGNTPSMEELMQNPNLKNIAEKFLGGSGAGGSSV